MRRVLSAATKSPAAASNRYPSAVPPTATLADEVAFLVAPPSSFETKLVLALAISRLIARVHGAGIAVGESDLLAHDGREVAVERQHELHHVATGRVRIDGWGSRRSTAG